LKRPEKRGQVKLKLQRSCTIKKWLTRDIDFSNSIWSKTRGYWRRLVNPLSLGKDKEGNKIVSGRTWVKPHTRMIWFKGEKILIKVPFKDLLSKSPW